MAGKSNTLDDLMMACSDLSSGSRGLRVKGPAVRDIRRTETQTKAVFQPSAKARDWRALDQNLESVFGEVGAPNPQMLPPQPLQPLCPPAHQGWPQSVQETGDEWGDFQEPTSFNTPAPTASVGGTSQSIGCR